MSGYIVIGTGAAGMWSEDSANLERGDVDLWKHAEERLFAKGRDAGILDRDGRLLGEGWIVVVGDHVAPHALDIDPAVIAWCETPADATRSEAQKGTSETDAWNDGRTVYLRRPMVGASCVQWANLQLPGGVVVTPENLDDDETLAAVRSATRAAERLARRWRAMPYVEAQAEYDAL